MASPFLLAAVLPTLHSCDHVSTLLANGALRCQAKAALVVPSATTAPFWLAMRNNLLGGAATAGQRPNLTLKGSYVWLFFGECALFRKQSRKSRKSFALVFNSIIVNGPHSLCCRRVVILLFFRKEVWKSKPSCKASPLITRISAVAPNNYRWWWRWQEWRKWVPLTTDDANASPCLCDDYVEPCNVRRLWHTG